MTYKGVVKGGVVVLDGDVRLPDGATVQVALPDSDGNQKAPSLFERLESVIGQAKGLPEDAASNIDRDLYGVDQP
jgi:hypothetical protein